MKYHKCNILLSFVVIIVLSNVDEIYSFSIGNNNKKILPTIANLKKHQLHQWPTKLQSMSHGCIDTQHQQKETIEKLHFEENVRNISKKLKFLLPALIVSLTVTQKPLPAMAEAATTSSNFILSSFNNNNILPLIFLTCTLPPTVLGFFKNEYVVSYGYGLALFFTALVNVITIKKSPVFSPIQLCHTLALLFYGIRLTLFLLYREITIPRFKEFTENIEQRASPNKLKRIPFMMSCSILYMCMSAPIFWNGAIGVATTTTMKLVLQGLVGLTWCGFLLNVIGDCTKSYVKYKKNNQDELVTTGIFKYIRHPNYTGEQIAWTGNFLLSIATTVAASCSSTGGNTANWLHTLKKVVTNKIVWASFFGWIGIEFVLTSATTALESRQKTKYGKTDEYKDWVKKSWAGFC